MILKESSVDKYLDEIKKRLLCLQDEEFNGKLDIGLNMKAGGIMDMRFCPSEIVKL